jgi:alpha/beta superfamily hydrolase
MTRAQATGIERYQRESSPWWTGWLYGFTFGACLAAVATAYLLCGIIERGMP